jgi:hypothetical protein
MYSLTVTCSGVEFGCDWGFWGVEYDADRVAPQFHQVFPTSEAQVPAGVWSGQDRGFDTTVADRTQNKGGPPLCLSVGDSD